MARPELLREDVSIMLRDGSSTSGVLALPGEEKRRAGVIVAHGAGNDMTADLVLAFADGLALAGYPTLRFNFLYTERGRKTPDKYETLADTWLSAAVFFRERLGGQIDFWVAAGKSMGGRVASQMAADGFLSAHGLIFLGYPLHPAGHEEKLRDAHLYRITMPMLFFAGTRDPLCNLERLRPVLKGLAVPWDLRIVENGDHSFHISKSTSTTKEDIYRGIVEESASWIEKISK
jgi:predicted alpha/beta-hydrolase family hydrolase